jgi:hypothetical protein
MTRPRRITTIAKRVARVLPLGRENGIALPTTVLLLFAVSTLGAVAVKQAITSERQSVRDRSTKRAIDAADAGSETAVYRVNKLRPAPTQCVLVNAANGALSAGSAGADGWCPEVQEDLGDGASFRYKMTRATTASSNGQTLLQRKVVSTGIIGFGNSREVRRRTFSVISANTGNPLVGNYAIISADPDFPFELKNNTKIYGDVGTNSSVKLGGSSTVCGDILYRKDYLPPSPQASNNGALQCPPPYNSYNNNGGPQYAPQPFVLGPVDQRCAQTIPNCNEAGTIPAEYFFNGDRNTRVLDLDNDDNVTLSGSTYGFCGIRIRNQAKLTIGLRLPGATPLRIYLDSPENCAAALPNNPELRGNFEMTQGGGISNLNSDPATLTLFVVGSPTRTTTVRFLQSTCTSNPCNSGSPSPQVAMVVYAPYSYCELRNTANLRGAMACKQVSMDNASSITWDPLVGALTNNDIVPLYRRTSYVECDKVQNPSPPDTGCS